MNKLPTILAVFILTAAAATPARAQTAAVKTNLLYGIGTFTPNLGVELGVGKRGTIDISGGYNWTNLNAAVDVRKHVHWIVQPEYRFWFRERFNGHFLGIHALGGQYNVSRQEVPQLFSADNRYEGWGAGAGVSYGYHWMWSKRWGMEFNIGVGFAYLSYDKFECPNCDTRLGEFYSTYFGPTKAGISLVYIFK